MLHFSPVRRDVIAVALVSATLLMIELALTRIFSVVMYYHFAFLAISIALFGLSASGVFAYVARRHLRGLATRINVVYAADLLGAAFGCIILIPLLDRLGAPGVVLAAAAMAIGAANL